MLTIGFLADYPDTIPTLAIWFREQWPTYYADWSQEELEQDFRGDMLRDRLPSRLVAFESNELVGTVILREQADAPSEYQPELGGLYVVESYRRRGIGAALIQAGMQLAHDQGYKTIYTTTVVAAGILNRLGWEFVKTVVHEDGPLGLYQCKL